MQNAKRLIVERHALVLGVPAIRGRAWPARSIRCQERIEDARGRGMIKRGARRAVLLVVATLLIATCQQREAPQLAAREAVSEVTPIATSPLQVNPGFLMGGNRYILVGRVEGPMDVSVNGIRVAVAANGRFQCKFWIPPAGRHTIQVVASESSGKTYREDVSFVVEEDDTSRGGAGPRNENANCCPCE